MRISDWSSDVCSSDLEFLGDDPGDAEVQQLDRRVAPVVFLHHHVGRLQVAMDDQAAMRMGDGRAHVAEQFQPGGNIRSEEHTSELQSLMRISSAVFCLKKKQQTNNINDTY